MLIVSGCQEGIDFLALKLARENGFETGGYTTKGFRTVFGCNKPTAQLYNIKEMDSYKYKDRTWKNVEIADVTLILAGVINSPGTRCTINACKYHNKPYYLYDLRTSGKEEECIRWLIEKNPTIINFAGNSPKTFPKIEEYALPVLTSIFKGLANHVISPA